MSSVYYICSSLKWKVKIELDKGYCIVYFDFIEMFELIMFDIDEDENVCVICWEVFI